jgi:hypothetical protein
MEAINYSVVVEMTDEEKLEMYMKLSKKEIAKMLIESNKNLDVMIKHQQQFFIPSYPILPAYPSYPLEPFYYTTGDNIQ